MTSPLNEIADALAALADERRPSAMPMDGGAQLRMERRAHVRRRPLDLPRPMFARLKHGPVLTLVDVSEGGALVETPARLIPGAHVVLEFLAPAAQRRALMPSRVMRSQVTSLDDSGLRYRGSVAFGELLHITDFATATTRPETAIPEADASALAHAIASIRSVAAGSRDVRVTKLLDDVVRQVQLRESPRSLMAFVEERLRGHVPLLAVVFGPRPRVKPGAACESLAFELGHTDDGRHRMHVEFIPACSLDDGQVRVLHAGASVMSLIYTWNRSALGR